MKQVIKLEYEALRELTKEVYQALLDRTYCHFRSSLNDNGFSYSLRYLVGRDSFYCVCIHKEENDFIIQTYFDDKISAVEGSAEDCLQVLIAAFTGIVMTVVGDLSGEELELARFLIKFERNFLITIVKCAQEAQHPNVESLPSWLINEVKRAG